MAGEWIKVRTNLWSDPRISQLCDLTDESKAAVIGGLYWLWASADEHTEDGYMPGLSIKGIDRDSGVKGLGAALVAIGWLSDTDGGVTLIRFGDHNGASAKNRAQTAKRVANHKGNAKVTPAPLPEQQSSVSGALPRVREEKEIEEEGKSKAKAASKSRKPTKMAIPDDFCLSPAVIAWAEKGRHTDLPAHFDSFVRKAKANGYMYADWDQALQNAIADDWAKLRAPQPRGSPSGGYQTANDKAKDLANRLTGKNRNEPTFDFIDLNSRPP
jgi:hypothetical protein